MSIIFYPGIVARAITMHFEAINKLYALDNCLRWLESSESKVCHFEGQNIVLVQNIVFMQNLLFLVSFRFSYFSGFLSPFEFEFLSKVLKSYLRMVKGL